MLNCLLGRKKKTDATITVFSSLSFFAALPFPKFFPNGPPSSLCSIFSFLPLLFRSERRMPPEIRVFSPRLILCASIVEQICQLASIVYAPIWLAGVSPIQDRRYNELYQVTTLRSVGRGWAPYPRAQKIKHWSPLEYTQMRVCPLL